ncbi:MAG: LysR family transcriptional regulator [Pseudolabrys sp.]|nr:LysR family transcriptional regulator [Pseudolabrys sp.]
MTNIPTDLLRTLIAVVDLRSFTKAAQSLGVTQPAVSAQIRRLQSILGTDLFDRSAPGVSLTPHGDAVVGHARRMLSINDQILNVAEPRPEARRISIGLPGDLSGPLLPWTLKKLSMRYPDLNFRMFTGAAPQILKDMREGAVDIVVALSHEEPTDARHQWKDQLVWVRSGATKIDDRGAVPMLAFSNECMCYRAGVEALRQKGRESRLIATASTVLTLSACVDAGLGTMVMTKGRVRLTQLSEWENAPLPALPHMYAGIYVREGAPESLLMLADEIAPALRPRGDQTEFYAYKTVRAAFNKAENVGGAAAGGGGAAS